MTKKLLWMTASQLLQNDWCSKYVHARTLLVWIFQPFIVQDFPMAWLTGFQLYFHGDLHYIRIFTATKLPGEQCPPKLDECCWLEPPLSKKVSTRWRPPVPVPTVQVVCAQCTIPFQDNICKKQAKNKIKSNSSFDFLLNRIFSMTFAVYAKCDAMVFLWIDPKKDHCPKVSITCLPPKPLFFFAWNYMK